MIVNQKFSYHNHTYRCGHAVGSEEDMVRSAIEEGYTHFGISDHAPFVGYSAPTDRMEVEDKEDYLTTCFKLKEKYKGQIDLVVGFEAEYDRNRLEELKELRNSCDYLLLGQHNKRVNKARYNEEYTHFADDSDVLMYAEQVCEAMETGLFAAVNHPDYFMLGRKCWSEACAEAARKIAECAARNNIPLELNLKGVRKGKTYYKDGEFYAYPYRKFWEEAAKYDVRVILGHDAHHPLDYIHVYEIDLVNEILEGLDLKQALDFRIK